MNEHKASRTLVKSPPELWAECSDASSLTRHLDQFGEIRITKLEPETAVAWEGERVSGTVRLEPSGWGTRVTLTAAVEGPDAVVVAEPELHEEPAPQPERVLVAEPEPEAAAAPEPEPVAQSRPAIESVPPPAAHAPPVPPVTMARPRGGLLARVLAFLGGQRPADLPGPPAPALSEPTPEPVPEPAMTEPEPAMPEPTMAEPAPAKPEAAPDYPPSEGGDLAHPDPQEPSEPDVSPMVADLINAEAALVAALDSLGQAHHRPFSRA